MTISTKPDPNHSKSVRKRRYKKGRKAEQIAMMYLALRGYRILARRFKTHAGEVDLIAVKGQRVALVEVKYRQTLALAQAAITDTLRQRVRRSANLWLAKHPRYQTHDIGFDLLFLTPWRWPHYIENGL